MIRAEVMGKGKRNLPSDEDGGASSSKPKRNKATTSKHLKQPEHSYGTRKAIKNAAKTARRATTPSVPSRIIFRCHRAGEPPAGSKRSKKCGCPHYIVVEPEVDENGKVYAVVTEHNEHMGHVPGDEEDRQWLPSSYFESDNEADIGPMEEEILSEGPVGEGSLNDEDENGQN